MPKRGTCLLVGEAIRTSYRSPNSLLWGQTFIDPIDDTRSVFFHLPMDPPSSGFYSERPAKRKREASYLGQERHSIASDADQRATNPETPRKTKVRLPPSPTSGGRSPGVQATATTMASSLTNEMTQILHKAPLLASSATEFLDLYLCLWECYVVDSARKIRLEDEHRSLQESNDWLLGQTKQLRHICNDQELLLWDRRQAFYDVQQGVLEVLQRGERSSCQVTELP